MGRGRLKEQKFGEEKPFDKKLRNINAEIHNMQ
jgi:hypothetical protein